MNNSALARNNPPKDADRKAVKDFLVTHPGSHTAEQIRDGIGWKGHKGLYRVRRRLSDLLKDSTTLIKNVGNGHDSTGSRVMLVEWRGDEWGVTQSLNSTHENREHEAAIEGLQRHYSHHFKQLRAKKIIDVKGIDDPTIPCQAEIKA